ncbi:TPA: hypothetical protein ACLH5A_000409 [Yersinia enterocolitica]|uniref:hypothetical protein n=1 Tax=Yersinia enterocolitica TaxID=630 RepID=UPI0028F362FE|nr:hypothetical protein [Yersinia enterocolitica]EKN4883220.1 hypothetical protein [Yersinia enterocolitica]HDL6731486.1 hypothetical protein [Yersinia enterocolitica]HDL7332101.1 hypothetical protein [Yersinia enterocolitica]HDL7402778.1 hypothetical protein [Yersinia enterocolitica]
MAPQSGLAIFAPLVIAALPLLSALLHHLRLTRQQDNDQPPVGLNNLCLDTMLHDEVTNGVNVWFGCEEETENF